MELSISSTNIFRLFNLKSVAVVFIGATVLYLTFQFSAVLLDSRKVIAMAESMCRRVEFDLQTGARRSALDYVNSGIQLAFSGRPYLVKLRDGRSNLEMGSLETSGVEVTCEAAGRAETIMQILVGYRPFNYYFGVYGSAALGAALAFTIGGISIQRASERMTMNFFEAEAVKIFGGPPPSLRSLPLLSRFFDQSKSATLARVQSMVADLKKRVDSHSEELKQQSARAALGDMLAHVAHDIRSPLSVISLVAGNQSDPDRKKLMAEALARLNAVAEEVLTSRKKVDNLEETVDILLAVNAAVEPLMLRYARDLIFNIELPRVLVSGSKEGLVRVFTILLENAVEAIAGKGSISISANFLEFERVLKIQISDSGSGFPPSVLDALTGEWQTTKPNGNGLGLRYVYDWVGVRKGNMTLQNTPLGARVTLTIPNSRLISGVKTLDT